MRNRNCDGTPVPSETARGPIGRWNGTQSANRDAGAIAAAVIPLSSVTTPAAPVTPALSLNERLATYPTLPRLFAFANNSCIARWALGSFGPMIVTFVELRGVIPAAVVAEVAPKIICDDGAAIVPAAE